MAKLENVKVLDMVGGEITRIAYDGAEYVKASAPVIKGDIVEVVKPWGDQHKGEFFVAIQDEHLSYRNDDDEFVYIDGNVCQASSEVGDFNIFRKVTATTPPIEERVSKLESRVDAIDSRLGNAKTTVDEPLKVGDYAKVLRTNGIAERGNIVKIVEDDGTNVPFKLEFLDGTYAGYKQNNAENIIRATDEEVAKAKAELKRKQITVGTYVKLAIKDGEYPKYDWGDVSNGEIGVVRKIDSDGDLRIDFESQSYWCGTVDEVEIVTAEEYEKYKAELAEKQAKEAEQKKWAEIGREVGEFRKGDIVITTTDDVYEKGTLGFVSTNSKEHQSSFFRVEANGVKIGNWHEKDIVELIVPVEQRFDLPEVTA